MSIDITRRRFVDTHNRDENTKRPLPRRLQELVAQYPYTTSPDPTADGLLTRPRFSTRRYDALFVRIEATYPDSAQIQSSRSPVGIFTDALKSEPRSGSGVHVYLWDQVKAAGTSGSDDKPLPAILSDDTINLFSLASADPKEQVLLGISSAPSTLVTPLSPARENLLSLKANGSAVSVPVRKATLPSSIPQSPKDWAEFSSAGFGETTISQDFASTLLDKDVEVTEPPAQRRPSKRRQDRETATPIGPNPPSSDQQAALEEPEGPKLVLITTEIVQLDEAFIDFWRDAVVDPVSSDWPKFIVGELKHPLTPRSTSTSSEDEGEASPSSPINWIIIEEKFRRPTPHPTPVISQEVLPTSGGLKVAATPLKRTSSPRPSFGEKKTSSLSATLRRFTLFGGSKDDLTEDIHSAASGSSKKDSLSGIRSKFGVGKSPRMGEMGEVLSEEPEPLFEAPKKVQKTDKVVAAAAGVVGGAVLAVAEGKKNEVPAPEEPTLIHPATSPTKREVPTPTAVGEPEQPQKALPEIPPVVETPVPAPADEPVLKPAPESVVSHGETPGPQLALDSTEAGLHHPLEPEPAAVPPVDDTEETEEFVSPPQSTIEHLEDKAGDPAADVGVDLDPVPIVSSDCVEEPTAQEGVLAAPDTHPAPTEPEPNGSPLDG